MPRTPAVCVAALLAASLLAGCSRGGQTAPTDSLAVALPINPTQLNPILAQNAIESFVDGLMFDKLVTLDTQRRQVPDLATVVPTLQNGGISKDGLTITYHLHPNIRWSDGAPLTSADVKFTWQAILNPNNNVVSHRGYDQVASVTTPNATTVVFHMKRVFSPAVDTIFGESDSPYEVLPAHVLAHYANLNNVPFNAAPVTSGPYRFVRWERDDRIVLAANPNYFRGAPHIRRLVLKIIPDQNTTEAQVRTHEVGLAIEIDSNTFNDLKNVPNVTTQLVVAPVYTSIDFNVQRAPLDDLAVRRAIAMSIDGASIARDVSFGTAKPAIADLSPFYWAFDPSLEPTAFDPAAARRALDADGWKVGPGGIRSKAGKRLSLQLVYGEGSQLGRNITLEVQQQLRAVGIDVQLKSYTYQILYAAAETGGILNGGKFDLALYSWVSGGDPDNSSQWTCSAIPPNGNDITRYCSRAMDALQRDALSTFDRTKRTADYKRIERLLLQDAPAAFVYYQSLRYAHVDTLHGFHPNGISEGWNAQEWNLQ